MDIKGLGSDQEKTHDQVIEMESKGGYKVKVPYKYIISVLVRTSLENDRDCKCVPLPGVDGEALQDIADYMMEHKGVEPPLIEKPLRSNKMIDVCPHKWDAEFIDKLSTVRQRLYNFVLATNYMDIGSAMHLGCAKIASLIKGLPLEKIREVLNPEIGAKPTAIVKSTLMGAGVATVALPAPRNDEKSQK